MYKRQAQNGANRETRQTKAVIVSATAECLSQAADLLSQYAALGLKLYITDTLSNSLFAPHLNLLDTSTMERTREGLQAQGIDLIVSLSLIDAFDAREQNLRRAGIDLGIVVTMTVAEAKQIGISINCGQIHDAPPVSLQDLHLQGALSFIPPAKNLATT